MPWCRFVVRASVLTGLLGLQAPAGAQSLITDIYYQAGRDAWERPWVEHLLRDATDGAAEIHAVTDAELDARCGTTKAASDAILGVHPIFVWAAPAGDKLPESADAINQHRILTRCANVEAGRVGLVLTDEFELFSLPALARDFAWVVRVGHGNLNGERRPMPNVLIVPRGVPAPMLAAWRADGTTPFGTDQSAFEPESAFSQSSRPAPWVFLGGVQNMNRRAMLRMMHLVHDARPAQQHEPPDADGCGRTAHDVVPGEPFVRTGHEMTWNDGRAWALGFGESCALLRRGVFTPCPTGNIHPETHRFYEAIECGSIPVVNTDYYARMLGAPAPIVQPGDGTWGMSESEVPEDTLLSDASEYAVGAAADISRLLTNQSALVQLAASLRRWWAKQKRELPKEIAALAASALLRDSRPCASSECELAASDPDPVDRAVEVQLKINERLVDFSFPLRAYPDELLQRTGAFCGAHGVDSATKCAERLAMQILPKVLRAGAAVSVTAAAAAATATCARAPVFIVGCSNSGTSLLTRLLDSHGELCAVPGETAMLVPATDADEGAIARAAARRTRAIANAAALCAGDARCARFVEKTPGHVTELDELFALFPAARVLLLTRDGRDVAVSIAVRKMRRAIATPSRAAALREAAAFWRDQNAAADAWRRGGARGALGGAVLDLRYERLATEPAAVLAEIATFLGEQPFASDALAKFWRERVDWYSCPLCDDPTHGERRDVQVSSPVTDAYIGRWRRGRDLELGDDERRVITGVLGPSLVKYGYVRNLSTVWE